MSCKVYKTLSRHARILKRRALFATCRDCGQALRGPCKAGLCSRCSHVAVPSRVATAS